MTVIFPFVNQMVQETGVDPSEVGYSAALIESSFTMLQFFTSESTLSHMFQHHICISDADSSR